MRRDKTRQDQDTCPQSVSYCKTRQDKNQDTCPKSLCYCKTRHIASSLSSVQYKGTESRISFCCISSDVKFSGLFMSSSFSFATDGLSIKHPRSIRCCWYRDWEGMARCEGHTLLILLPKCIHVGPESVMLKNVCRWKQSIMVYNPALGCQLRWICVVNCDEFVQIQKLYHHSNTIHTRLFINFVFSVQPS